MSNKSKCAQDAALLTTKDTIYFCAPIGMSSSERIEFVNYYNKIILNNNTTTTPLPYGEYAGQKFVLVKATKVFDDKGELLRIDWPQTF